MAVQIGQVQRHARHAVEEGRTEQQRAQIVGRGGRKNGQAAAVAHHRADSPAPDNLRDVLVLRKSPCRSGNDVVGRNHAHKRAGESGNGFVLHAILIIVDRAPFDAELLLLRPGEGVIEDQAMGVSLRDLRLKRVVPGASLGRPQRRQAAGDTAGMAAEPARRLRSAGIRRRATCSGKCRRRSIRSAPGEWPGRPHY